MGNLGNAMKEMWLVKIQMAWDDLFLVIIADSSLEEIEEFHKRLSALPKYTQQERSTLRYQKLGITEVKFSMGNYLPDERVEIPKEPVTLLELPQGLLQKGSKSWKIKI
jgi:hypothetical protein